MRKKDELGVIIESGAQDWQIFQQDADGTAAVKLRGRWLTNVQYKKADVIVRVLREDTYEAVSRTLDWSAATTRKDGTWAITLGNVPRGGLYRIETALQLDDGAIEWAPRGDMVHHLGVGDIWVITGQSNAAGYGKIPVEDAPMLGIHMFHASGQWKLATHPLGDSTGTLYPPNRENANASHSPWLAFARQLSETLGYPVGLIPASLGGSAMSQWDRKVNGVLFENMLRYIRDAGGRIKGAVWYQGESDTGPDQRKVYLKRFRNFVMDLRRCMKDRSLPVITAQLNRYVGEPYSSATHEGWEVMREIQRQAAKRIEDVFVISTLDLGLSDGIHTGSGGNLVIGQRMASVALGGVYGLDVKYLHPDCSKARRVSAKQIELTFDNIDTRLHFENNIPEQFPFAVRDEQGSLPVAGWAIRGRSRLRIRLARPMAGKATVTGAPTACPPTIVPMDIAGYRPMLGFTMAVG